MKRWQGTTKGHEPKVGIRKIHRYFRAQGRKAQVKCHCCSGEHVKKSGSFSNRNRIVQRFQCLTCGKTFSESQPLDGTRIDADKAATVVQMLCEGVGIRAIARLTMLDKNTVLNVLESAGEHCREFLDRNMRGLRPSHVEVDEIWTFVLKKQYHAKNHPVFGDQYCWLSFDEPTKLISIGLLPSVPKRQQSVSSAIYGSGQRAIFSA